MRPFTLCKRSPWIYALLLLPVEVLNLANQNTLPLLNLSNQNAIQDDDTTALQRLENLIVGKFAEIENKLSNVAVRLSQMDQIEDKLSTLAARLSQMDEMDDFCSINSTEEKTQLVFNPTEIMLYEGQYKRLDCGVIGMFNSCHWKHGDVIYQLADVKNASYSGIKASSIILNQCGIIISSVKISHMGVWTCNVFTASQTLTASRTISIGCPGGFFKSNGSEQCFKFFGDQALDWDDAESKCESEGLQLAQPSSAVAVTLGKDLVKKYGKVEAWLGARGDDNTFVWLNGSYMWKDNHLYKRGSFSQMSDNNCLILDLGRYGVPERPFYRDGCWEHHWPLCEVVMQ